MPSLPANHSRPVFTAHQPKERDRQAARTYKTNSKAWALIRNKVLIRDCWTCQKCRKICQGLYEAQVDHIKGDFTKNRLEDLQTLCRSCHSEKTAKENQGFGNPKR